MWSVADKDAGSRRVALVPAIDSARRVRYRPAMLSVDQTRRGCALSVAHPFVPTDDPVGWVARRCECLDVPTVF